MSYQSSRPTAAPVVGVDTVDPRVALAELLAATPIDEAALRPAVWSFVGAQHRAGAKSAHIILALAEMIDAASGHRTVAETERLTRRLMFWCIEAYFGPQSGATRAHGSDLSAVRPLPIS